MLGPQALPVNILPPRGQESSHGVSVDLLAHTEELIRPFPMQFFLSNQRVSTSPVNLPKCRAHRAFQNPKDFERLGKGLPSKAQSSSCTPAPGGSLGIHGILSLLSICETF